MANIDITLETGLINDYGVFNLNKQMLENNLYVDVVTDGNQFVESEEAKYQHGGESNFKDHEGIKPIDLKEGEEAKWDQYGTILNDELKKYIEIPENNGTAKEELWENYKNYINQFEVKFDSKNTSTKNSENSGNSGNPKEIKYISYNNKEATSKSIQTYELKKNDDDNKISIQTNIIHFSKYYSIYELTFSNQKVLCPLLYSKNDLNTYNIQILDDNPYLSYLTSLKFYRDKKNGHMREYLKVKLFEIKKIAHSGPGVGIEYYFEYNENGGTSIIDYSEKTHGGHQWSQFKTNPTDKPTFGSEATNLDIMPSGFYVIGFGNINGDYYFNKENTQDVIKDNLPQEWLNNFYDISGKLHRDQIDGGLLKNNGSGDPRKDFAFLGLMYKGDKNGNWHIFNTYFPVLVSGGSGIYNVSQSIMFKEYNSLKPFSEPLKYPMTIGLILSSILTSIYIYKDQNSKNIKYISDIVFLEKHSTLYTKDIVYKLYKNSTTSNNDLLLFRGYEYSEYLKSFNTYLNITEESDDTIKDNNIKAVIKSCIKNVPLQFKLEYLQPELSNVNNQNVISVQKITGEEITCASDIVEPNELYYLDDNNRINYLNSNFKIKWLESLKLDESTNTLIGTLDHDKEDTSNSLIQNMFNYQGGRLGFNTNEVISSKENCYSIVTYNDNAYTNALHDILINDILLPAARIL